MHNQQLPGMNGLLRKPVLSGVVSALPKISCLTATYNRLASLKKSIDCFCRQTYSNKELVIVSEGSERYRQAISRYVTTLNRNDIKIIFLTDKEYTLGEVRNISIENASGDIICQWDDDDQYHPDRLIVQLCYMVEQKADVCYLTDQLHFFTYSNTLVWEDWTCSGHTQGEWQLIPGTLMMHKDSSYRYPESGDNARKGEDSVFLQSFYNKKNIARLGGAGPLYLYTCHGRNTFSVAHHEGQQNASFSMEFIHTHEKYLRKHLLQFQVNRPCRFITREGTAFLF